MITADHRLTKIRMALLAIALVVLLVLALRARGVSQQGATPRSPRITTQAPTTPELKGQPSPKEDDVKSIDSIIAALYDVISGPAGDRDWSRFRSLLIPEARLIPVRKQNEKPSLRVMTAEDFVNGAGASFKQNGFFESEVARKQEEFGHIAQVFSTYESRRAKGQDPFARGINSIDLFNDGQRWWIVQIMWDAESPGQTIPEKYLH